MDYRTLHMKTVVELRQLAKELKVKVPAGTAKSRLVELVLEGQLAAAERAKAAQREVLRPPSRPPGRPRQTSRPCRRRPGRPGPPHNPRLWMRAPPRPGTAAPPTRQGEPGRGGCVHRYSGSGGGSPRETPAAETCANQRPPQKDDEGCPDAPMRKRQDRRLAQCRPLRRPALEGEDVQPAVPAVANAAEAVEAVEADAPLPVEKATNAPGPSVGEGTDAPAPRRRGRPAPRRCACAGGDARRAAGRGGGKCRGACRTAAICRWGAAPLGEGFATAYREGYHATL